MFNCKVPKEFKELELVNFNTTMEILANLWQDVSVNNRAVGVTVVPAGCNKIEKLISLVSEYQKQPSVLEDKDIHLSSHLSYSPFSGY